MTSDRQKVEISSRQNFNVNLHPATTTAAFAKMADDGMLLNFEIGEAPLVERIRRELAVNRELMAKAGMEPT